MIAVYIDNSFVKYQNMIVYTLDSIMKTIGYEYKIISEHNEINENDIVLLYGDSPKIESKLSIYNLNNILIKIPAQSFVYKLVPNDDNPFKSVQIEHELLRKTIKTIELDTPIPVITNDNPNHPVLYFKKKESEHRTAVFTFDLLSNVFFHLSYMEDKLKENSSLSGEEKSDTESLFAKFVDKPYVNRLLWLIDNVIIDLVNKKKDSYVLKKEIWPQAEKFAAALSHNVNRLQKWSVKDIFRSTLTDLLMFYKFKHLIRNLMSKIRYIITNIEEYWTFDTIYEIEEKHKVKSTFFWGVEREKPDGIDYDISDVDVIEEIKKQQESNYDIALLASQKSAKADILEKEQSALEKIIVNNNLGLRHNHYTFDYKFSENYHNNYGFHYDSTIKLTGQNGFKNGIGYPYHSYRKQGGYYSKKNCLELPVCFDDDSLILSKIKKVNFEDAKIILAEMIQTAEKQNAFLGLNFSVPNFHELPYAEELYDNTLEMLKRNNCYLDTFSRIASWWKKREAVIVEEKQDEAIVYFPHKLDYFTLRLVGKNLVPRISNMNNNTDEEQLVLSYYGDDQIYTIDKTKITVKQKKIIFRNVSTEMKVRIRMLPTAEQKRSEGEREE